MSEVALTAPTAVSVAISRDELLKAIGYDLAAVKAQYAPNASDSELAIYLDQAAANNLDPRKREVYFVKYGNSPGQTIVGYQTYIQRAERTGLLNGWKCELMYTEDRKKMIGAKLTVWRKDWEQPFEWTVDRSEFDSGKSIWKQKPGFMTKKVCMAQGFRTCFSQELGSMPYTRDEMGFMDAQQETAAKAPATTTTKKAVAKKPPTVVKEEPADQIPMGTPPPVQAATPTPKATPPLPPVPAKPVATPAPTPVADAAPTPAAEAAPTPPAVVTPVPEGAAVVEVLLAEDVIAKTKAAFAALGFTDAHLQAMVGPSMMWTERHRQWLLGHYKKVKNNPASANEVAALRFAPEAL